MKEFDNINGEYYVCDSKSRNDIESLNSQLNQLGMTIANIKPYIFNLNDDYRYIFVSKIENARFQTIKDAIDWAVNDLGVSKQNPVGILIAPGVYNEKLCWTMFMV